jgi:rod shape determining protein RodA
MRQLLKIDFRIIFLILLLMVISLFVISSATYDPQDVASSSFFTPFVKSQIKWFLLGWFFFFLFAFLDYRKLANWIWPTYLITVVALLGLFLVPSVRGVHRWYQLGFMDAQPSEVAKLIVMMALAWFLDKYKERTSSLSSSFLVLLIAGIPFFLILKQPDLGTALVLYPITLVMSYFGNIHKKVFKTILIGGVTGLILVALFFTGVISHEGVRPFFTSFMKEYQYERLNPDTYHQRASQNGIAIGGLLGSGWRKSELASNKWLPAAHTDSVFATFGEEFGFVGVLALLFLFYILVHFSFQTVAAARDQFGRLLSSGIAIYLAMHIIVNIGMMCGFMPIAGVPLVLITYGGSSVITTMIALGILQSIYIRRFVF